MFHSFIYLCVFLCYIQSSEAWFGERLTLREDVASPGNIIAVSGNTDITATYLSGQPVPRGTNIIISAPMFSDDGLNTTYGKVEAVCKLTSFMVPGQPGICEIVFNFVEKIPDFGKGTITSSGFFPGLAAFVLNAEEEYTITGGTGDFEANNPIREKIYGSVVRRTPNFSDTPFGPSYHTWTFRRS